MVERNTMIKWRCGDVESTQHQNKPTNTDHSARAEVV